MSTRQIFSWILERKLWLKILNFWKKHFYEEPWRSYLLANQNWVLFLQIVHDINNLTLHGISDVSTAGNYVTSNQSIVYGAVPAIMFMCSFRYWWMCGCGGECICFHECIVWRFHEWIRANKTLLWRECSVFEPVWLLLL